MTVELSQLTTKCVKTHFKFIKTKSNSSLSTDESDLFTNTKKEIERKPHDTSLNFAKAKTKDGKKKTKKMCLSNERIKFHKTAISNGNGLEFHAPIICTICKSVYVDLLKVIA